MNTTSGVRPRALQHPPHPAGYYRQQAARARRVAEVATTRAVKTRLLDDAVRYDELAAQADRAEAEAEKQ